MKLKQFQKTDLARAAMHDGLIAAWDTGLGKTWFMFVWPLLKCGYTTVYDRPGDEVDPEIGVQHHAGHASPEIGVQRHAGGRIRPNKPILIVAPGDLHAQIIAEAWQQFRIRVRPLESQEEFERLERKGSPASRPSGNGSPASCWSSNRGPASRWPTSKPVICGRNCALTASTTRKLTGTNWIKSIKAARS